jgi:GTP-dependent dephospho-CoA kinase
MTIAYQITPELREKLKEPFGDLIKGSTQETMNKLGIVLENDKPVMLISVGDTVSKNLLEYNLHPQIAIIDFLCMRKKIEPFQMAAKKKVNVANAQGTITLQAIEAIKNAVKSKESTQIIVDGEEDLLTLIAVLYAPINSLVIYGQPHEGMVLVKVTSEKKLVASEFLKAMENTSKS